MTNQQSATLVRLPWRFLMDHLERDWEGPKIVKETKTHFWARLDDPGLEALYADASYYADAGVYDWGDPFLRGLMLSAKAVVKAVEKARKEQGASKQNWDDIHTKACEAQGIDPANLPNHI